MFREVKMEARDDGWFEILERGTPEGSWHLVAKVWGSVRAAAVTEFLQNRA